MARADAKSLYSYWPTLLPDSPYTLQPSLFTVVLHDPAFKVRGAAVAVIAAILETGRSYLAAADELYVLLYCVHVCGD